MQPENLANAPHTSIDVAVHIREVVVGCMQGWWYPWTRMCWGWPEIVLVSFSIVWASHRDLCEFRGPGVRGMWWDGRCVWMSDWCSCKWESLSSCVVSGMGSVVGADMSRGESSSSLAACVASVDNVVVGSEWDRDWVPSA
jgi:hypothetical protein